MESHEINKITGERIQKLREERHMSQKMLAGKMYVGRSMISSWENGNSRPNVEQYERLTQIFEVSHEFLTGMDDKELSDKIIDFEELYGRNIEKRKKHEEKYNDCENVSIDLNKLNKSGKMVILELYESLLEDKKYKA